ncbi:hypothetical protein FACS1894107_16660 [Planctomycetales bacterium]|nr:hypothetical protein FACS1894107_16660 [Planctomycetales bacterium]
MSAAPAPVAPPPPKIAQQFVLDKSQAPLTVSGEVVGERLHLHLVLPATEKCYLHWGLARRAGGAWTRPPKDCCPPASAVLDELAVRTPFTLAADEENSEIFLELPFPSPWQVLEFVLYFPAADQWRKNGRDDFALKLPSSTAGRENPAAALLRWYPPLETDERRSLTLDSGYDLSVLVRRRRRVRRCATFPSAKRDWRGIRATVARTFASALFARRRGRAVWCCSCVASRVGEWRCNEARRK